MEERETGAGLGFSVASSSSRKSSDMPVEEVAGADGGDFTGTVVEDFAGIDGEERGLVAGLTAGRGASSCKASGA